MDGPVTVVVVVSSVTCSVAVELFVLMNSSDLSNDRSECSEISLVVLFAIVFGAVLAGSIRSVALVS